MCVLCTILISQKRKETLLLRSFLKIARNQNPGKWVVNETMEDSGFYEVDGLHREYSTETANFHLKIGKYLKKKRKNGDETICYSYRMFISTKGKEEISTIFTIFNDNRRIAKTYKQIDQKYKRMEKTIGKQQKLNAKVKREDFLLIKLGEKA